MGDINLMDSREAAIKDNSRLNDAEFDERKIILESTPNIIFIQAAGPCNSNCAFCSRGKNYEILNFNQYKKNFEKKLFPFLEKCEKIVLTGSGEFLQLPEGSQILDFFDNEFPCALKSFATNGSSLEPHICDRIINGVSKYEINISLHASKEETHKIITRTNNFHSILGKVKYLLNRRHDCYKLRIHLFFVATTLNIEDFPDFIRLASNLKADKVICNYNYIYIPTQKYLSCFFKQSLTNKIFAEAEKLANNLNMPLELPPMFGLKEYPDRGICREAWGQIMIDGQGHVLPCDASEDWSGDLQKEDFMDIWNSRNYQNIRNELIDKKASCFKHCFRANPASVNEFSSHVIYRGRNDLPKKDILWGDNF